MTPETPERVLAAKVAARVKDMNRKAGDHESLIFLVVEHFAGEALREAADKARKDALAPYENMVCFDRDRYLNARRRERAELQELRKKD